MHPMFPSIWLLLVIVVLYLMQIGGQLVPRHAAKDVLYD